MRRYFNTNFGFRPIRCPIQHYCSLSESWFWITSRALKYIFFLLYLMVFIEDKETWSNNICSNQTTLFKNSTTKMIRNMETGRDQGSNLLCIFFKCRFKSSFLLTPLVEYLHTFIGQKFRSGGRIPGWWMWTCIFISFIFAKRTMHMADRHATLLLWIFWWRLLNLSICQVVLLRVPTLALGGWEMIEGVGIWRRGRKSG